MLVVVSLNVCVCVCVYADSYRGLGTDSVLTPGWRFGVFLLTALKKKRSFKPLVMPWSSLNCLLWQSGNWAKSCHLKIARNKSK